MPRRIFLVGTNTEIGKTSVLQAILNLAQHEGITVNPFKPAQSGKQPFEASDAGRIMLAAQMPAELLDLVCPHRYPEDRAPGSVHHSSDFTHPPAKPDRSPLEVASQKLQTLEQQRPATWTFCEGAGGLHVPMPGGTWQLEWITRLSQAAIVVAPVGLGTINHTILTIEALQGHRPILGIAWTGSQPCTPELAEENMAIVQARTGLPALSRPDHEGGFRLIAGFFPELEKRNLELHEN